MSTRRKLIPAAPGEAFTLFDELAASPSEPMPQADAAGRVRIARQHLENLRTLDRPSVMDWRVVAMVGNVLEIMIERGMVQDPDGLLQDAQAALLEASERALSTGAPIRFSGAGLVACSWLLDSFDEVLATAPHRMMIQAFRRTDQRMRALDRGERRPGDYVARGMP